MTSNIKPEEFVPRTLVMSDIEIKARKSRRYSHKYFHYEGLFHLNKSLKQEQEEEEARLNKSKRKKSR